MKTIYVYDHIDDKVLKEIREVTGEKSLDIRVNSGGGFVFDGIALYNLICNRTKNKNLHTRVTIDGIAAGVASWCFLCADEISMDKNAYFILTRPYIYAGDLDLAEQSANIENIESQMMAIYENHLAIGREQIMALMESEKAIDVSQAIETGLATRIKGEGQNEISD